MVDFCPDGLEFESYGCSMFLLFLPCFSVFWAKSNSKNHKLCIFAKFCEVGLVMGDTYSLVRPICIRSKYWEMLGTSFMIHMGFKA